MHITIPPKTKNDSKVYLASWALQEIIKCIFCIVTIFGMNKKNPRTASHLGAIRGLFLFSSKHNRYLTAVFQRIYQAVIVVYGNFIDHSVPELFIKLDGRCFKLFKLGEHTADGYGLGFHSVAPCGELFVLFLLGAEAVGEVIV